ncbi:metallophosphoesterase family protein [Lactococcus insecticola]|uniref:Metallophosphoesterase n=1 Tax=Pseudolactococcus insecticola TaxID=2709158 RepID=A0A6A0BAW6_9LACT|nr:DNA repair exonuclease [Lactococcus insecticola]GFH40937.1 metallophosphoesterase [Lactococcus insecticola]
MKFIHTADLHLDREFEGLVQEVTIQPYEILEKIIDFAISKQVELVIFAGDNFHQSKPSIKMQTYFIDQLARLLPYEIQVVVTFGNHDYYRKSIYWVDFPENVTVFTSETVESRKITLKNGESLMVTGFSYEQPHITEDKVSDYPARNFACDYHIGVFHGEMSGSQYAPASLTDMLSKDYDYWALGHIHLASQLSERVIYPGTPQGRTKKEITNFVVLGTLTKTTFETDFHDLADVHFETLMLDLSDCQNLSQALRFIRENLDATQQIFYSLIFENYDKIATALTEVVANDELIEELRQDHVIVKIKLARLNTDTDLPRLVVPDFQAPAVDFTAIFEMLPRQEVLQEILEDPDFHSDVLAQVALFESEQFVFDNSNDSKEEGNSDEN